MYTICERVILVHMCVCVCTQLTDFEQSVLQRCGSEDFQTLLTAQAFH